MTSPDPGRTGATRDTGAVLDRRKRRFPLWLLFLGLLLLLIVTGILLAALSGGSKAKVATVLPAPVTGTSATVAATPPLGDTTTATTGTAPTADAGNAVVPSTAAGSASPATPAPAPVAQPHGGLVGGGTVKPVPAAGSFAAGDTEGTVLFAENSAALTDYARTVIADAAKAIKASRPSVIVVSGYTDEIAGQPANLKLSSQRATAVLTALKADVGPGPTAYSTKDHGERDPIATNTTAGGRQQNRRATITTD